ncbi:uncharacterized protein N7483_006738 [Penicillium malachiteum]|uniref:uncharacterized protein n=1 Tax=Penicillium malachiteum TaxID=1324776 RepID=UPI0025484E0A|nr:uncharacterized protein N7483_006738 [Penicillium malachiteum]KAJ5725381.1 hypothetical protein N7483_006738 [Penicillium malachiteum]
MEGRFWEYLTSPLFTFVIGDGDDKKEVTVHSSAIAGLSPVLNSLMNGEMIEAKTRRVEWSDVDGNTFARLCEFAYLRNYSPPSPSYISPPEEAVPSEPCEEPAIEPEQGYGYGEAEPAEAYDAPSQRTALSGMTRKMLREHMRTATSSRNRPPWATAEEPEEPAPEPEEPEIYPDCHPQVEGSHSTEIEIKYKEIQTTTLQELFSETLVATDSSLHDESNLEFKPPRNTDHRQDFTPVFLGQARLYVLADKYLIESLRTLILAKMFETLANFKVYPSGIEAIVKLVRFVYDNTPPNYGDNSDPMRDLVTRFVVSVLGQIGESKAFQGLLEDGGSFVADFWHMVWVHQS